MQAYSQPITPPPTTSMLAGMSWSVEDLVRVVDARVVEREDRRPVRRRADGDQDHLAPELDLGAVRRA